MTKRDTMTTVETTAQNQQIRDYKEGAASVLELRGTILGSGRGGRMGSHDVL